MSVTPEIEADILRAHGANPKRFSPFKVAKQVGATIGEVLAVVNKHKAIDTPYDGQVQRASLERFIVASRRVTEGGWNNDDVGVHQARRAYEAGTHDMATYRDGPWLHLCSFPLQRPRRARPGFFTGKALA